MPKRSQTERAAYAVKRRKEDYEAKRFNNPLRIFLERKYPKILEEFTELYNFINFVNPGKKDLTKTLTFKQWLTENPALLKNISPSTTENTFSSIMASANRETETTTTTSANRETETTTTTSANRETETNTISDIVDELFGPNGIPDEILSDKDEGIVLNHFDELAFDIEPFDFLAETEGF